LLVLLYSVVSDAWRTNQRLWNVIPLGPEQDQVLSWLRQHDPATYLVEQTDNYIGGSITVATVRNGVLLLNSGRDMAPRLVPTPGAPDGGLLVPAAKYIVGPKTSAAPAGAQLVQELPGGRVYAARPGLPFAFLADRQRLPYGAEAAV
jgi:hypothetical protein